MIEALRASNANYDHKIAFIYVDWDEHSRAPVSRSLRVRRQSTLVMLTKQGEAGRLVAQTSDAAIRGLLDGAPARPAGGPACTG